MWDSSHTHTHHTINQIGASQVPTKKNLFHRKVTSNDICESCGGEVEDTIHALWECQAHNEI